VRHALLPRYDLDDEPAELGRALADELLEPCAIYTPQVLGLARSGLVHAAAHVTGGGLVENVPRALPSGFGAEIERGTWPEQPVFALVQAAAGATDEEMFSSFNMGVGFVLVVAADDAEGVLASPGQDAAFRIGRVVEGAGLHIV
jgi:phosphoribosylformylglycinamidine cyclo-ligase